MTRSTVKHDPTLMAHAYLDGELDPVNAAAMEERRATDPAFAGEYERAAALQQLIRDRLPRETLPPGLRSRIEASVAPPRRQPSWRALAASIVATAFIASSATWMIVPQRPTDTENAVVAGHIRSLMATQPFDVASSDRHTVKPWFNGRIPQAPHVVDLAKDDFPLVGGRLDVVGRTPVPTLVYRHAKHLISVTAVPAPGRADMAPARRDVDGYNIVHWTENGVAYWAISDVSPADLGRFAQLFRAAAPEQ